MKTAATRNGQSRASQMRSARRASQLRRTLRSKRRCSALSSGFSGVVSVFLNRICKTLAQARASELKLG
jgi:hypothetical protein